MAPAEPNIGARSTMNQTIPTNPRAWRTRRTSIGLVLGASTPAASCKGDNLRYSGEKQRTEVTKQASQFLFTVLVYNLRSSQLGSRVHAHVERTVSNEAETALRIFQLARRNTKIKKRAADSAKAKLIENAGCMPEIRLPHDQAPAKMCQLLAHMRNCIRILIEGQNVSAALQKRFGVATAAGRSIYDEQTRFWLQ